MFSKHDFGNTPDMCFAGHSTKPLAGESKNSFGNTPDMCIGGHSMKSSDAEDWMQLAQAREDAFFGEASTLESIVKTDAMPVSEITSAPRASIVEWLRLMLVEYGLSCKLPSALTLWDAIHATERTDSHEHVRPSQIIVLGIVLVLVKLHVQTEENSARMILRLLDVKDLSVFFRSFDLDASGAFVIVTQAVVSEEMRINDMLGAVTLSPSPPEWAAVIVWRLLLSTGDSKNEIAAEALPLINYLAITLHEQVATNSRLPPKALAVGACARGLMSSNAMDCSPEPQFSLRRPFSFEHLAKAANCSKDHVRHWAFNVPSLISLPTAVSKHVSSPASQAVLPPSPQKPFCGRAIPKISTLFDMRANDMAHCHSDDVMLTIHVIRFPRRALPEDLRALFRCCGETESAQVVLDRHGSSRCYGFVRFCAIESIQVAIQACKDEKITMTDDSGKVFVLKANLAQKNIPEIMEGDRSTFAFSCRADDHKDQQPSNKFEQATNGHYRRRPRLYRNSSLDIAIPNL